VPLRSIDDRQHLRGSYVFPSLFEPPVTVCKTVWVHNPVDYNVHLPMSNSASYSMYMYIYVYTHTDLVKTTLIRVVVTFIECRNIVCQRLSETTLSVETFNMDLLFKLLCKRRVMILDCATAFVANTRSRVNNAVYYCLPDGTLVRWQKPLIYASGLDGRGWQRAPPRLPVHILDRQVKEGTLLVTPVQSSGRPFVTEALTL
jgi:hypothetical protein